jgi:hypothetical protein
VLKCSGGHLVERRLAANVSRFYRRGFAFRRMRGPNRRAQPGARRAGAGRRTANTARWLKPMRRGIGASNCATRSAPSSNSCAAPSRSCAGSSTRRTIPSEPVDSSSRRQARHLGSSTRPGRGAGIRCGRRYATAGCCSSHLARRAARRTETHQSTEQGASGAHPAAPPQAQAARTRQRCFACMMRLR